MKITIDLDELARNLADDLQITDTQLEELKNGEVPDGWTNTILDILENDHQLESKLAKTIIKAGE